MDHNLLRSLSSHELFKIFHNCTIAQVCQISKSRSFNIDVLQLIRKLFRTLFMTVYKYFLFYCTCTEITNPLMFLLSPYIMEPQSLSLRTILSLICFFTGYPFLMKVPKLNMLPPPSPASPICLEPLSNQNSQCPISFFPTTPHFIHTFNTPFLHTQVTNGFSV
jgi:hypothetical protein